MKHLMKDPIVNFQGTVFSNFSYSTVTYEGVDYPSVEHAYQAAKFLDPEIRKEILSQSLPSEAKTMGRNLAMLTRADWKEVNVGIMEGLLRQKFTRAIPKRMLISTYPVDLIEGNWWHDVFWGVCDGSRKASCNNHKPYGENNLGKLLMKIRKQSIIGLIDEKIGAKE